MTLLGVSLFLIDLGMNFILCECSEIRRPEILITVRSGASGYPLSENPVTGNPYTDNPVVVIIQPVATA